MAILFPMLMLLFCYVEDFFFGIGFYSFHRESDYVFDQFCQDAVFGFCVNVIVCLCDS